MGSLKKLAMIFLAIYLIVTGISTMGGISLGGMANCIVQLLAVFSGLFIFVCLGTCSGKDACRK